MPTTVHIPPTLLKSVDRRAKALGVSRNRIIVRALEQAAKERLRCRDRGPSTSAGGDRLRH
jgi:metal-responsive CopG/Arc/MetJ family transcriptional regulator